MSKRNQGIKPLNLLVKVAAASLTAGAIAQQLRRSAEERTWHGTIARVPYDFRPPTPKKMRNTFWNKNTARIVVPQPFGVGWTLNFYPLVHPQPAEPLPESEG